VRYSNMKRPVLWGFVLAFQMSLVLPQPTELKLNAEDKCSQRGGNPNSIRKVLSLATLRNPQISPVFQKCRIPDMNSIFCVAHNTVQEPAELPTSATQKFLTRKLSCFGS
jgi:hypothetical protein